MTLAKEQLSHYLIGSLRYSAIASTTADLDRSLNIYRKVLANGYYHLPLYLVHDFLMILYKGTSIKFRTENGVTAETKSLEETQLSKRYERECLARLLQSPDVTAAIEITTTSKDPVTTTGQLLLQLLSRLGQHYPDNHWLNPSLLRDYQLPADYDPFAFFADDFTNDLETFLANLNQHINWGQLLYEEDRFELAHFQKLNTDHLRIGCRQILEVSRLLKSTEPIVLDLKAHENGVDTAFVDETHYPTGGLSGLTNRGSYENLLTSELVYIDEGTEDVSLFDLRYAEGELLFYLRDSGNLRRKRRSIHFVLDVNRIFESKLPGYKWQYSVLIQGFCLRLLLDLFEIFEMDALQFHFHYIGPDRDSDSFIRNEIGLMETVLGDYANHGWVTFSSSNKLTLESLVDPKRKSYAIVFADAEQLDNWEASLQDSEPNDLQLHTAVIGVDTPEHSLLTIPRSGLSQKQLNLTKQAVLEQLVS